MNLDPRQKPNRPPRSEHDREADRGSLEEASQGLTHRGITLEQRGDHDGGGDHSPHHRRPPQPSIGRHSKDAESRTQDGPLSFRSHPSATSRVSTCRE